MGLNEDTDIIASGISSVKGIAFHGGESAFTTFSWLFVSKGLAHPNIFVRMELKGFSLRNWNWLLKVLYTIILFPATKWCIDWPL